MTSPWAPQPKQWKKPLSSLTVKLGDFSLWKGHRPEYSRPLRVKRTVFPMTDASGTRERISSRKLAEKVMLAPNSYADLDDPLPSRATAGARGAFRSPQLPFH